MGWNDRGIEREHPLVDAVEYGDYAYFIHSYGAEVAVHTAVSCDYGFDFAAIATNEEGNVMGTQFYPEKSGEIGLQILHNFVEYVRTFDDVPANTA